MTNIYTINYTDATIKPTPITLDVGVVDTNHTSLTLYGYGAKGYAVGLLSNSLQLLENFCSKNPPNNPTEGQLWYNSGVQAMYVCYKSVAGKLEWKPVAPVLGWDSLSTSTAGTVTTATSTSADTLSSMLQSYVPSNGNVQTATGGLTGNLKLYSDNTWYSKDSQGNPIINTATAIDGSYAATVKYVNTKVRELVTQQTTAASADWSVTPNQLRTLLEDNGSPYIKKSTDNINDRTMLSALFLRDQANPLSVGLNEAVSRVYVDTKITKLTNDLSGGSSVPQYILDLVDNYVPVMGLNNPKFKGISTHLPIFNDKNWYTTDNHINTSVASTIKPEYAATIQYVNAKVADELSKFKPTEAPAITSQGLISKIEENGSPYIRTTKTAKGGVKDVTMVSELLLRDQTNADSVVENEAVSRAFVEAKLTSVPISSTNLLKALEELAKNKDTTPVPFLTADDISGLKPQVTDNTALQTALDEATAAAKTAAEALANIKAQATTNGGLTADELAAAIDKEIAAYLLAHPTTATTTITGATGNDTVTSTTTTDTVTSGTGNDTVGTGLVDTAEDPAAATGANTDVTMFTDKLGCTVNTNENRVQVRYTKMDDGTLIVYGYYRYFGLNWDGHSYIEGIDQINLPTGCPPFIDTYYAVTVTEATQPVKVAGVSYDTAACRWRSGIWKGGKDIYYGYPAFRAAALLNADFETLAPKLPTAKTNPGKYPWSEVYNAAVGTKTVHANSSIKTGGVNGNSLANEHARVKKLRGAGIITALPATFTVYEQTKTSFRISGSVNRDTTWLYARNMVACNFTAIGRWK